MIIKSSTPTRISLFGGGSDINPYAEKYGGACLSMAINLRQEIIVDSEDSGVSFPIGGSSVFYKTFINEYGLKDIGYRAKFDGEITGGIGSSASAAVAILGALHGLTGKKIDPYEIAEEAWDIEVNDLKMFGGKQDQYAAAFGGVNLFEVGKAVKVTSLPNLLDKVKPSILLFHVGQNRKSSKIQEGLKNLTNNQVFYLDSLKELTYMAVKKLPKTSYHQFGEMLNIAWELKKESNKGVSTTEIDNLFDRSRLMGAYGGKILGAGGGGYCIFVVEPRGQKEFIRKIGIKHIPFEIDYQGLKVDIL